MSKEKMLARHKNQIDSKSFKFYTKKSVILFKKKFTVYHNLKKSI